MQEVTTASIPTAQALLHCCGVCSGPCHAHFDLIMCTSVEQQNAQGSCLPHLNLTFVIHRGVGHAMSAGDPQVVTGYLRVTHPQIWVNPFPQVTTDPGISSDSCNTCGSDLHRSVLQNMFLKAVIYTLLTHLRTLITVQYE